MLISVNQAAKRMNIDKDTLYKLCHLGEFPHLPIGKRLYVVESDIEKWIEHKKKGSIKWSTIETEKGTALDTKIN